ncbi:hypothetical protein BO94DRAFT_259418 [Aspergillus sclerotioniger CBS 115572]|uniref:Uncharacterized protein n=1 Tax=Aspergillus sclerotioniger CBS 115572 TaxID=1450535 RepID=A0A317VDM7_9EURO|nr:hypothetical protein BO94DRAFT_259418 [Aspergillus sclerotioniger CBS 115572]PWY71539.1 hypothetical protein BO94DRAFT_259418 [Aspergillus sclerotioniger CBS 115572]
MTILVTLIAMENSKVLIETLRPWFMDGERWRFISEVSDPPTVPKDRALVEEKSVSIQGLPCRNCPLAARDPLNSCLIPKAFYSSRRRMLRSPGIIHPHQLETIPSNLLRIPGLRTSRNIPIAREIDRFLDPWSMPSMHRSPIRVIPSWASPSTVSEVCLPRPQLLVVDPSNL